VLGVLGAAALSLVISQFLYGVSPLDPMSFLSAAAVLLAVAALACYLPARHASRLDPLTVLRAN
jgi:ABC-type antimicrobial peptide transport system permease subunit